MRSTVVAVLALVLLVAASSPALAAIHPLARSECSNPNAAVPANNQNPPGISQPPHADPGPDQSRAATAQPVFAVIAAAVNGAESLNAFQAPGSGCPAPQK